MCYALPGPRCSGHAWNDLCKKRDAYHAAAKRVEADPEQRARFDAAEERYQIAVARFNRSPRGVQSLREEAERVRARHPEQAAALESIADKGHALRQSEKAALSRSEQVEERVYVALQKRCHETGLKADALAAEMSANASPEQQAELDRLHAEMHAVLDQASTTPLGIAMLEDDLRIARNRVTSARTGEERDAANRSFFFHQENYERAVARRAEMKRQWREMANGKNPGFTPTNRDAEQSRALRAREVADRMMREEQAKDGLATLLRAHEVARKTKAPQSA